jgi:hypothetical protein
VASERDSDGGFHSVARFRRNREVLVCVRVRRAKSAKISNVGTPEAPD